MPLVLDVSCGLGTDERCVVGMGDRLGVGLMIQRGVEAKLLLCALRACFDAGFWLAEEHLA